MKKLLPASTVFAVIALLGFSFLIHSKTASAQTSHLVISEVQIAGASPSADFVEIYNPTSSSINLGSYNLVKRTSSGSTDTSIINFGVNDVIKAHGFLLWCFRDIASNLGCDKNSTDTISNNNSVAIRNGSLNTGAIVDSITIGVPLHPLGEGDIPATPSANKSVERKANGTSTSTSMGTGGSDELAGNAEDTDNNASDFVLRSTPQPQNSFSSIEPPLITDSPTPSQTPTPTLTPTPTDEPTPTSTPSDTPTPTLTPTLTQTPTPTPSDTPTPTSSPTLTPTPSEAPSPTLTTIPTLTPTLTPTPSVSPSPTPTPNPSIFSFGSVSCSLAYKAIRFLNITIQFPFISCHRT